MFFALGAIMQYRSHPSDSDEQLKSTAKQLLADFYIKFQDEPAFIQYVQQEWEGKFGEPSSSTFAGLQP